MNTNRSIYARNLGGMNDRRSWAVYIDGTMVAGDLAEWEVSCELARARSRANQLDLQAGLNRSERHL